jgi:hypothetical protein
VGSAVRRRVVEDDVQFLLGIGAHDLLHETQKVRFAPRTWFVEHRRAVSLLKTAGSRRSQCLSGLPSELGTAAHRPRASDGRNSRTSRWAFPRFVPKLDINLGTLWPDWRARHLPRQEFPQAAPRRFDDYLEAAT